MSERERLIELLQDCHIRETYLLQSQTLGDIFYKSVIDEIADYLLDNGVIVLPPYDRVYFIVDGNSPQYRYIDSKSLHSLTLYEIQDLSKYGYYTTKEEALKALKGGAE